MIDIHSHILPGLDDGARSMDDALDMLRMAAAAGTTDMVATPHASPPFRFDPDTVERAIADLQSAAGPSVRIHYGCELHMTLENMEDALRRPGQYSIGHAGYLLVEFSPLAVPRNSGEVLARLARAGLRPIVAHPERNPILRECLTELEEWTCHGCLLQVTAQSLLGRFGKSARGSSQVLIGRGLVHLVASDAHDPRHRPPVLDEAFREVADRSSEEIARRLFEENPRAVLDGLPVAIVSRKKRWAALW
jgi:protein-tyrosine phosphatase